MKLIYQSRAVLSALAVHGAWLLASSSACAELIALTPSADTTLSAQFSDYNSGANLSLAAGNTAGASPTRALVQFNVAAVVPAGARITSATLLLTVTRTPTLPEPVTFELHRLLVDWNEGSQGAGASTGFGGLAATGEATWNSRKHGLELWSAPGGAAGVDYAAAPSGSAGIETSEPALFESNSGMVGDLQRWLDTPAANFGWLVKDQFEFSDSTARRFGSKESGTTAPILLVEYEFNAPWRIDSTTIANGEICCHFTAKAGRTYKLLRRAQVDTGDWTPVATLEPGDADGPATLCDALLSTGNQFYRLSEE